METDYKEIYLDIICSKNEDDFILKMESFCDLVYNKLISKLKEVHLNKNRMDFSLIISIEDINNEVNEFVDKINNNKIISNQHKVAENLLYGLIIHNDPLLWAYFNQKYLTFYN